MEILRWEVLAPVIGVIGLSEAFKKTKIKIPTAFASFVFSAILGALSAAVAGTLTPENAAYTSLLVYGMSTLAYEMTLKRFNFSAPPPPDKPETPCAPE